MKLGLFNLQCGHLHTFYIYYHMAIDEFYENKMEEMSKIIEF